MVLSSFLVLPKRHRQVVRRTTLVKPYEEEKAKIEPISEASEFLSSLFSQFAVVF